MSADARATGSRSVWWADVATLAGVGVLVVVAAILDAAFPRLDATALLVVGIVIAGIPAVLWLALFYRRDRLEPEPRGVVVTIAILGGLLAAAIGRPLIDQVFVVDRWLSLDATVGLVGSILIVGVIQETLKFLGLRFSIYRTSELDGPTDGVVYGTAIGLGYATVLNVAFVLESGGGDLALGTIRIALFALVHASLGGLIGYALGRQKVERRPVWWLAAAVFAAAVLDGAFLFLRGSIVSGGVPTDGLDVGPWLGLLAGAVLAAVVTGGLQVLIGRDQQRARTAGR